MAEWRCGESQGSHRLRAAKAEGIEDLLVITDQQLGDGTGTQRRERVGDRAFVVVMTASARVETLGPTAVDKPMDLDGQMALFAKVIEQWRVAANQQD